MNKKVKELLPKNITEDTVKALTKLLEEEVETRVQGQVKLLTSKVIALVKSNVQQIQESALKQLEETNETFRKAKLFEHVAGIMALETTPEDYDLPLESLTSENAKLEEAVVTLTNELNKSYEENSILESKLTMIAKKIKLFEARNEKLQESMKQVDNPKPFKSSEKAQMISRNKEAPSERDVKLEKIANTQNEFLSESMIKLATGK